MRAKGPWLLVAALLCSAVIPAPGIADTAPVTPASAGYITVTSPPVADFFTSTRYGSAPFTVSFSDSSQGSEPRMYHWEFGDGSTSEVRNPAHTYKADGEYDVSLTVINRYGSDTKTAPAYIGIGNPPVPDFSAAISGDAAPLTVAFADATENRPTAWRWDFGDGGTSSEQNPFHTYAVPGTYTVTLTAGNNFGSASVTKTRSIVISSPTPLTVTAPTLPEEKKPEGIIGLIRNAQGTTEKNLPTSGLIPPQFMALAAVGTSLAVILVQFLTVNIGMLSSIALKFAKFFAELAGEHTVEKISDKEVAARRLAVRKMERRFFGLSATEVLIIEAAVVMVALAFLLADRAELTLMTVIIYMGVGAVSVVLHDFAHRFVVTRHGYDADTRFWGLGTAIMFLTAYLFGNAFAQPYRNLVNREGSLEDSQELGIEMVAGPCVSIILMVLFLAMSALGGVWAVAGGVGFTINLITAVYSLMPIATMDGLSVWKWNRAVYLGLFVPVFAFYVFTYVVVA